MVGVGAMIHERREGSCGWARTDMFGQVGDLGLVCYRMLEDRSVACVCCQGMYVVTMRRDVELYCS